jgi:hypothetical protein
MTGALGSTFIAAHYWDNFAVGCALAGIPIVVGENVVGVDRKAVLEKGRISSAPELDRRIDLYKRYQDDYGAMIVQLNVETRERRGEYIRKYGRTSFRHKWGRGPRTSARNQGQVLRLSGFSQKTRQSCRSRPSVPMSSRHRRGCHPEFAATARLG